MLPEKRNEFTHVIELLGEGLQQALFHTQPELFSGRGFQYNDA